MKDASYNVVVKPIRKSNTASSQLKPHGNAMFLGACGMSDGSRRKLVGRENEQKVSMKPHSLLIGFPNRVMLNL